MRYKHFEKEEFACPCCGENKISSKLVGYLDRARELSGVPFVVTSGYRCEKHNEEVGGVPGSSHTKGLAADIAVPNNEVRYWVLEALFTVGFKRIGVGDEFVHVDIDDTKKQFTTWLY